MQTKFYACFQKLIWLQIFTFQTQEWSIKTDIFMLVSISPLLNFTHYPDGLFTAVQEDPSGLLQHSSCLLELSVDWFSMSGVDHAVAATGLFQMCDASCSIHTPCGQLDPCEPSQVWSSELHRQNKKINAFPQRPCLCQLNCVAMGSSPHQT